LGNWASRFGLGVGLIPSAPKIRTSMLIQQHKNIQKAKNSKIKKSAKIQKNI